MDTPSETLVKDEAVHGDKVAEVIEETTLRLRIKHFTWAQFILPLSTGGISLLLASTPHRFPGLDTIGKIFFILDLVIFVAAIVTICARFAWHSGTFKQSLAHPTEALFVPTVLITSAYQLVMISRFPALTSSSGQRHRKRTGVWRSSLWKMVHNCNGRVVLDIRGCRFHGGRRTIPQPLQRAPESVDRAEHDTGLDFTDMYDHPLFSCVKLANNSLVPMFV